MPKIPLSPESKATLMPGLEEHEVDMLQRFLVILRNHSGCTTPLESLIYNLVYAYSPGCNLGPDDVDHEVQQFKQEFADAIADAQRMLRDYRRFIEPPQPVPESIGEEA